VRRRIIGWILPVVVVGCGSPSPSADRLLILVAASTVDAVEEVAALWETQTGERVDVSAGPSSGLAMQIRRGAPAGLFLSAHPRWVDELASEGLVDAGGTLLTNQLVVVVPADSSVASAVPPTFLTDSSIDRIALAEPGVPAGIYADEALRRAGVAVQVDKKAVRSVDARAALAWVERGEADAGIVYATDAAASNAVRIVHRFGVGAHTPIRYVLTVVAGADDRARAFEAFLRGDEAARIFASHGFERAE